ncbi:MULTISPECIES: hypothetical protein, partial [Pirellulaceae]|uniref:hypothetical protein n=1 Tax=Pirellulaceae TaxID=2691357 RepID=UPI001BE09CED
VLMRHSKFLLGSIVGLATSIEGPTAFRIKTYFLRREKLLPALRGTQPSSLADLPVKAAKKCGEREPPITRVWKHSSFDGSTVTSVVMYQDESCPNLIFKTSTAS